MYMRQAPAGAVDVGGLPAGARLSQKCTRKGVRRQGDSVET